MKLKKQNLKQRKKQLKEYTPPTLKKYGSILSMTSGGSSGKADGGSGKAMA